MLYNGYIVENTHEYNLVIIIPLRTGNAKVIHKRIYQNTFAPPGVRAVSPCDVISAMLPQITV